jgi:hypothetical protein
VIPRVASVFVFEFVPVDSDSRCVPADAVLQDLVADREQAMKRSEH